MAWSAEGATVCEGIEHENALEVDPQEKGEQLRLAIEAQAAQAAASAAAGAGRGGKKRRRGGSSGSGAEFTGG